MGEYRKRVFSRQQEEVKKTDSNYFKEMFDMDWGLIEGTLISNSAYTPEIMLKTPVITLLEHYEYCEYFKSLQFVLQMQRMG